MCWILCGAGVAAACCEARGAGPRTLVDLAEEDHAREPAGGDGASVDGSEVEEGWGLTRWNSLGWWDGRGRSLGQGP